MKLYVDEFREIIVHRLSGSGFNVPGWKNFKQLASM